MITTHRHTSRQNQELTSIRMQEMAFRYTNETVLQSIYDQVTQYVNLEEYHWDVIMDRGGAMFSGRELVSTEWLQNLMTYLHTNREVPTKIPEEIVFSMSCQRCGKQIILA